MTAADRPWRNARRPYVLAWIPPASIATHCLPPHKSRAEPAQPPGPSLLSGPLYQALRKKFVFDGAWDLQADDWDETDTARKMQALAACRDLPRNPVFLHARARLETRGFYKHKNILIQDVGELKGFFERYFMGLIDSIASQGYDERHLACVYQGDTGDAPSAFIGRDGRVIKSEKGRHRFAVARICRPETPFPLVIRGMHEAVLGQGSLSEDQVLQALAAIVARHRGRLDMDACFIGAG